MADLGIWNNHWNKIQDDTPGKNVSKFKIDSNEHSDFVLSKFGFHKGVNMEIEQQNLDISDILVEIIEEPLPLIPVTFGDLHPNAVSSFLVLFKYSDQSTVIELFKFLYK